MRRRRRIGSQNIVQFVCVGAIANELERGDELGLRVSETCSRSLLLLLQLALTTSKNGIVAIPGTMRKVKQGDGKKKITRRYHNPLVV